MPQDHGLPGFNFNIEGWDAKGLHYETLAICRSLALARVAFEVAIEEKPAGRFMIRSRTRVVKRHPKGDWLTGHTPRIAVPFYIV
jgi:hypothetical protein